MTRINHPTGLTAAALLMLTIGACTSTPSAPQHTTTPPAAASTSAPTASAAAQVPAGARIADVVPIPNSGPLTVDDGAVWVIDRGLSGDATAGMDVTGRLMRIDPASLKTSVVAQPVIGAQVAIEGGSAWVSAAFLDRLLRIDPKTGRVQQIRTGTMTPELAVAEQAGDNDVPDMFPYGVVAADGAVWVANHDAGNVARFDATTGKLVASIPILAPGGSGPANLATDGKRVWVTASRSPKVFEIDAATNTLKTSYDVSPGWACGGSTFDGTNVWVTSGHDQADPCHEDDAWSVSRVDPATGDVTHVDVGGRPMDVAVGLGAVWVVVDKPHPALVRLDPATLEVVGRLPLPLVPNITNPMDLGEGAIWIRVVDFWSDGMSAWPGAQPGVPAVLRLEPEG
jgi:streptogramin lyase